VGAAESHHRLIFSREASFGFVYLDRDLPAGLVELSSKKYAKYLRNDGISVMPCTVALSPPDSGSAWCYKLSRNMVQHTYCVYGRKPNPINKCVFNKGKPAPPDSVEIDEEGVLKDPRWNIVGDAELGIGIDLRKSAVVCGHVA
jgi:hypothetical protein